MAVKLCLVTFSNNADHQNVVYSMYKALKDKADVYTLGIVNPKSDSATFEEHNIYCNCPERPGIGKGTFCINVLLSLARKIKQEGITHLYFESQHLWNAALMALCPRCKKIVAVHDVIPHDGNKAMDLSNFITCQMADQILLRNQKYRELLSKRLKVPAEKISSQEPWREFHDYSAPSHNGIFLCFGRIRKYKGFDKLEQIVAATPEITYRIVGEPDEESRPLIEELKKYANTQIIDREVSDQEMVKEFERADWTVLPYTAATQSGVIVDSLIHARPVIAFDVGAISEQIVDGYNGRIIPAGDVMAFVKAVREANDLTAEELNIYSKNAHQFAYERYSAEAAVARFWENVIQRGNETV